MGESKKKKVGGRISWRLYKTSFDLHFEKVLKQIHKDSGWTQQELFLRRNVWRKEKGLPTFSDRQSAFDILNSNTQPTMALVEELSGVYGVPARIFLPDEEMLPTLDEKLAKRWQWLSPEQQNLALRLIDTMVEANVEESEKVERALTDAQVQASESGTEQAPPTE